MIATVNKGFRKIYDDEIRPTLAYLENARKEELMQLFIIESVLLTALIAVIIFSKNSPVSMLTFSLCPFLILALGVFMIWFVYKYNDDFVKRLKGNCMHNVIKYYNNMKLTEKFPFSSSFIGNCNLFSQYTTIDTGEKFVGKYNNIKYKIAETTLRHISGSGKNRREYLVFKGVIISFPMNKCIRENTIVATKLDRNIKNNFVGIWSSILGITVGWFAYIGLDINDTEMFTYLILGTILFIIFGIATLFQKKTLEEVKLEDPVFARKFKVFSADQVEARYLVTTAFMERFLNLNTAFGTKKAKCAFYNNEIIFAISTNKNLFEIGSLFTPLDNSKHMSKFFKELSSILSMIDYFKLDEHTGL